MKQEIIMVKGISSEASESQLFKAFPLLPFPLHPGLK